MARCNFSTSSSVRYRNAPGFSDPNSSGPMRTRLSFSTSLPRCLNIRRIWLLRPSAKSGSYGFGLAGALNGALQLFHFVIGQIAECSGFQRPQFERADAHALEFLHQLAQMLEHQADLVA